MSRRDLGVQLQGVRANSQLSTPCYTAKEDSIVDEQDDREQSAKRTAYKANYTKDQKKQVYDAWVLFMREISRNIPFFIYFEKYYGQHKQFCALTKTWILSKLNLPRDETSNPTPRQSPVKSLPSNPSQSKDKSALEIVVQKAVFGIIRAHDSHFIH